MMMILALIIKLFFLSSEKIELYGDSKFPKNMEFPNSSDVYFGYTDEHDFIYKKCDFNGVQSISFKDGAKVSLKSVENLPPNLDFSCCDKVDLEECDLSNQPDIRFKDGAIVKMWGAQNLPHNIDFSRCDEVTLRGCDLSNQPNLSFKDGAIVKMLIARNLPHNIDFSHCDEVNLNDCDLNLVEKLTFKNREQMEKSSAKIPDDWKGKLVFADEQTEMQTEKNINEEKTVAAKEDDTPMAIKTSPAGNRLGEFIGKIFAKGGR